MNLDNVAPKWARIWIIPGIAGLGVFGIAGGLYIGFEIFNGSLEGIVVAVAYAGIFLYTSWRGFDLVRFRGAKAAIDGEYLRYQKTSDSKVQSVFLGDISITDFKRMQIINVDLAATGSRLFSVDYLYKGGMGIVAAIRKYHGEQGGGQNSLPGVELRSP